MIINDLELNVKCGSNGTDFNRLNTAAAALARSLGTPQGAIDAAAFMSANRSNVVIGGAVYTWHHLDNYDPISGVCTMQLVRQDAHNSAVGVSVEGMAHGGGASQYRAHKGRGYK